MIVDLPQSVPELPSIEGPPVFLTITRLAQRAAINRAVILRLVAQGEIVPDAFVELGSVAQPVFRELRAADVVRHAQTPKRAAISS